MADLQDFVLQLRGLRTEFHIGGRWHPAVRDLDLSLRRNETLAIVGESGSGKSVTALSILRLLPEVGSRIAAGEIHFNDVDLLTLDARQMQRLRGNDIAIIFQEPMTSLNPTMRVGEQLAEALRTHGLATKSEAAAKSVELLRNVRIPSPEKRARDYPHQFSGGMRQRVMIAMALACNPRILLADEPTTALDVTIQAQILALLNDLKKQTSMSVLFITHNLGVVAQVAERVAVMYAGQIVEIAPVNVIFERPVHPYTRALLATMPRVDRDIGELEPIPGSVPSPTEMPEGCAFAERCRYRKASCSTEPPQLQPLDSSGRHQVRCPVLLTQMETTA